MTGEDALRPGRRVRRGRLLRARQRPGPGGEFGIGPPVLNDGRDVSDDSDDEDSTSSTQLPQPTDNLALPSLGLPTRLPFLPGPETTLTTESTTTEIFISTTVTFPDINTSLPSLDTKSSTTSRSTETASTAAPVGPDLPLFYETTFVTSVSPSSTISPIGATSDPYSEVTEPSGTATAKSGIQPGAKAGIAVGSIAGIALLVGFLFFLLRWIRTRRFHSSITVESSRPRRHGHTRSNSTFQLAHPPPTYSPHANSNTTERRDSQVLRDLLAAAHAHQNGGAGSDTSSTLDEKTGGAVVENAQIRNSIASWLRRHHPLKLNPMADGNDNAGTGGSGSGGNMRSSFFSTLTRSNRNSVASSQPRSPGLWPRSPGLMVPSGGGGGVMPRSPLREVHGLSTGDDGGAVEEGRGVRGREGVNSVWSESSDGHGGERGVGWGRR